MAATTPFVPSISCYSSKKHLIQYKTPRLSFKVNNNLDRELISCLPTSVSWPISVRGSRTLAAAKFVSRAYVSGPAFDAIVSESDPKIDGEIVQLQPIEVISWGLLWKLVSRHKWRVLASFVTLFGCTSCTLAMPLFSGVFFGRIFTWEVVVAAIFDFVLMLFD